MKKNEIERTCSRVNVSESRITRFPDRMASMNKKRENENKTKTNE